MKLLLHICCGPCALYPLKELLCNKFDRITGFFYNPNIHPPSEYKKRKDAVNDIASKIGLDVIVPAYKMEEYFSKVFSFRGDGFKPSLAERCSLCWELRLSQTADFAKHNGFDAWTTTLLISPYQNHDEIKKIGEEIANKKEVKFYYQDFREGFKESHEQAKTKGLYRQKYCGCVFSHP